MLNCMRCSLRIKKLYWYRDMSEIKNIVNEQAQDPLYEKVEMDQLRDGLNRSFKERFLMATTLYKIQQTLKRAKITHKPYTLGK